MRRTSLLSAAALVLVGSSAFAQAKPSFVGKWTILPDSSVQQQGMPRGGAAMGGLSEEATITQDDKTISIARELTVGPMKSVFNLDGTESHQSLDIGNGNIVDLTLKAKWEGKQAADVHLGQHSGPVVRDRPQHVARRQGQPGLRAHHPGDGEHEPGGTEIAKYKKTP